MYDVSSDVETYLKPNRASLNRVPIFTRPVTFYFRSKFIINHWHFFEHKYSTKLEYLKISRSTVCVGFWESLRLGRKQTLKQECIGYDNTAAAKAVNRPTNTVYLTVLVGKETSWTSHATGTWQKMGAATNSEDENNMLKSLAHSFSVLRERCMRFLGQLKWLCSELSTFLNY